MAMKLKEKSNKRKRTSESDNWERKRDQFIDSILNDCSRKLIMNYSECDTPQTLKMLEEYTKEVKNEILKIENIPPAALNYEKLTNDLVKQEKYLKVLRRKRTQLDDALTQIENINKD